MPAGAPSQTTQGEPDSSFADQRVWTTGGTARRARRQLRIRNLLVVVALLLALVGGLATVYARPDLCPIQACRSLNTVMHRAVPSISGFGVAAPTPFTPTPASLRLTVIAGANATTTLLLTNPGAGTEAWQATTNLGWLTISPGAGSLDPGAHVVLGVTAKAAGVTPGTYASTLTVISDNVGIQVPITVVVAAGAHLSVSPASLAFQACGTQQSLTARNTGEAPLSFTATPTVTAALAISAPQHSLAPSASTSMSVTLTCQAIKGEHYAIILTSNGGSATVSVTYGS
jgi:hypothetical protein